MIWLKQTCFVDVLMPHRTTDVVYLQHEVKKKKVFNESFCEIEVIGC